jgi:hypothetical protein
MPSGTRGFCELWRPGIFGTVLRTGSRQFGSREAPKIRGWHPILASDLTVRRIEEALQAFTPSVRNAFQRYLRAVLNYGVKRDYLSVNPVLKLDFE